MDPGTTAPALEATVALAHQLFELCRKSSNSYKLLASSLKQLRNVLEELEDFVEDPSAPHSYDSRVLERIVNARTLLEQLQVYVTSSSDSQNEDAMVSIVADFKTALDSSQQELQLSEDAVSAEDISGHLSTRTAAPPSASLESASNSAPDSTTGYHTTSWTSGPSSIARQDSARDSQPHSERSPAGLSSSHHQHHIIEKETIDSEKQYLSPKSETTATSGSLSRGWNSPWSDPMSTSIEEASSWILADDEPSYSIPARPRSRTGPVSSKRNTSRRDRNKGSWSSAGLGISIEDYDNPQQGTDSSIERLRAYSLATPPDRVAPAPLKSRSTGNLIPDAPPFNSHTAAAASDLREASESGHLSPIPNPRSVIRSRRTHSSPSIAFSQISNHHNEPVESEDNLKSVLSFREELCAVLNDASSDPGHLTIFQSRSEPVLSEDPLQPSAISFGPPPARKAPSPPKRRARPKIPKNPNRFSAYRIVNAEPPDSSSEEEDLYSTSRPTSPVVANHSSNLTLNQRNGQGFSDDHEFPNKASRRTDSSSTTSSQVRPRHAEQVLKPRAYTSPSQFGTLHSSADDPSTASVLPFLPSTLAAVSVDGLSPPARNSDSLVLANDIHQVMEGMIPTMPERTAPILLHHPPRNQDRGVASSAVPISPTSTHKEMLPEGGLESETRNPADPEVAFRRVSVSTEMLNAQLAQREWYGPNEQSEKLEVNAVDQERIEAIVHYWNLYAWDTAQEYLEEYLKTLVERNQIARARRVRHLIGVCLSFRGYWTTAIPHLLSVLRAPITNPYDIDAGDCAAAYWLGDCYALLNQRTEAWLAYCIAERSALFQDRKNFRLAECIIAEQEMVRFGISRSSLEAQWARESPPSEIGERPSILHSTVVSPRAALTLLEMGPRRSRSGFGLPHILHQNQARSNALVSLDAKLREDIFRQVKLENNNFDIGPNSPWPMMFDPFFAMANVRRGRLITYECDLLSVFNSNTKAKVPTSNSLSKMDCFTAQNLDWLITTVRQILQTLEMQWSEVANVEGTWFVVRYSFMQNKIATTYYFSIALFRQSLRAGYGVDICPDGICSARIIRAGVDYKNGAPVSESKRIKKLIRDCLDEAAKEPSFLQPEPKAGNVLAKKSFAGFRQRKRSGEEGGVV